MNVPPSHEDIIPFNRPTHTGCEQDLVLQALNGVELTEGEFNRSCRTWLQEKLEAHAVFLTPSCTHALEMAALLLNIGPGDEVIMPSYTFASAASAIALRGGVPVFIDIKPDTMNIDEALIESAITPRTRAIMVMHYAGIACDMEKIKAIAQRHGLPIIEDAAQGFMAHYNNRPLGTLGTIGAFSFHQTKNVTAGEGGALIINDPKYVERAQILRHKGTNRVAFLEELVTRYEWADVGSSWTMNELNAAYLYGNLLNAQKIFDKRQVIWNFYENALAKVASEHNLALPAISRQCQHNAHIFYIKMKDMADRADFISFMKNQNVCVLFHYTPLHDSIAGKKYGRFHGEDRFVTKESEKLVRLPLFYNMTMAQAKRVVSAVYNYYGYKD